MSVIDQLEIVDGYFDGERFIMRGIAGYAVFGTYKAEGLRSMARLIQEGEPLQFTIDKERTIFVPVEQNGRLKQELLMIADELEAGE
jgi:hypothetical protein